MLKKVTFLRLSCSCSPCNILELLNLGFDFVNNTEENHLICQLES